MDKLKAIRTEIDKVDDQISTLLEQRFELVRDVKEEKMKTNYAVEDINRELDILARFNDSSYHKQLVKVYSKIFEVCKEMQVKK
jgi:chorismate mutase